MITTAKLAAELGLTRFGINYRINALKIKPTKVGSAFLLTPQEADKIRRHKTTPGPAKRKNVKRKDVVAE